MRLAAISERGIPLLCLSMVPAVLIWTSACAWGEPRPTSGPWATSGPASAPAPLSSGDPQIDSILDRLEIRGQAIKGLSCEVIYKFVTVDPVEDAKTKEGRLWFARAEPNARFRVEFQRLIADGVVSDWGEAFLFDGQWLVERNDKARTIRKTQIVRPGQRVDPFKIGQGPFPLPFGQKRAEILALFRVTLEKFALGDPRNTAHLHCVPLPQTELAARYRRVEMYIDRDLELPVRVVTERVSDGNRIEVDFRNIDASDAPAGSRFHIEEPKDYDVNVEPLPEHSTVRGVVEDAP